MIALLAPRPDRIRRLAGIAWSGPDEDRLRAVAKGKLVLVTGASSGIGAQSTLLLAAAGATVIAVARREQSLTGLAGLLPPGSPGAIVSMPTDLTDEDQVRQLIDRALSIGTMDIVVSNAGRSIRRPISQSYDRLHDFTRTMAINYTGPVQLLLGLLPSMRARRSGHIINISTVGVDMPTPYWSAYSASKSAFETWFQCMAPEARADGVRSTSIHFGLVHTAMSAPTENLRNKPGMSASEAAAVIGRAVVDRPRMIRPWWAGLGAVGATANPAITDALNTLMYRGTRVQARLSRSRSA